MIGERDRRSLILGFAATAVGAMAASRSWSAEAGADASLRAQPWAVWDDGEKPVRGGYLRLAASNTSAR